MSKTSDPFAEFTRKATEAALQLTQLSMAQGENMLKLQLSAMRNMLHDSSTAAKALLDARDPQQWSALQERNMRDMMERLNEYSRSIQDLASRNQDEVGEVVESRLNAMNEQCQSLVEAMAAAAPPGSAPVFAAMKQSLAAAHLLVGTMSRSAQDVVKATAAATKAAPGKGGKGSKGGKDGT